MKAKDVKWIEEVDAMENVHMCFHCWGCWTDNGGFN
jgi:hypothetical protein